MKKIKAKRNIDTYKENGIYFYWYLDLSENGNKKQNQFYFFRTIEETREFCNENGIKITNSENTALTHRQISYCTIDPMDKQYSDLILLSNSTLEGLWGECKDIIDIKNNDNK